MHPVECNTVGLYKEPVCVLDFASLYPSLFRAYNMSYDTLLHDKRDAKQLEEDQYIVTPTGEGKTLKEYLWQSRLSLLG